MSPRRHPVPAPARVGLVVLGLLTLAVTLVGAARPASAATGVRLPDDGRVLLVSVPRLTWNLVDAIRPPAIGAFVDDAGVASLSVRTIGPVTTAGEGYATIGAGNRATASTLDDGLAFEPGEEVAGTLAGALFERRTGRPPDGAAVVQVAIGAIHRSNDRLLYGAEAGTLGTALADAGRSAAVVGVADTIAGDGRVLLQRQAALAVMDRDGRVAGGRTTGLLVDDPVAPGGLRMDGAAVLAAARDALAEHDVVLVELSDLDRVDADRPVMTAEAYRQRRRDAVEAADAVFAELLAQVDLTRDLVVLLAPAAPRGRDQLTVFALDGPGVPSGDARSATTRRPGYVTLPDVAPTLLHALRVAIPDEVTGTRITVEPGSLQPHDMAVANTEALFRNEVVGPMSVTYIVVQVVVYGLAVVALTGQRSRLRPWVQIAALTVLAVPLVAFLSGLVRVDGLGVAAYVVAVMASAVWPLRRVHLLLPPLLLVAANLLLQLVDVASGGWLQLDTPFGYSPIVAGRFAGFGNLAFALVAMAAIVTATGVWGLPRQSVAPARDRWLVAAGAVLGLTLVMDGLPAFGSDVGGVLSATPAFAVTMALLGGWRIGWRRLLVVGLVTLAVVTAFALADLARPEDSRTHLGRFVAQLLDGEGGTILRRKLQANVSILTSSVWTYVIPAALAFLAFLTARRTGFMRRLLDRVPGAEACVVGGLTAGALGFALNDSGVAIPAMMFGILLPHLAYLVLATERRPG